MDCFLVDYTEHNYHGEARSAVASRRSGKFVQIRSKRAEYLVLSSREVARYHADIAELFCHERKLSGFRDGDGKRFDIHEPGWGVVGGGRFEWDDERKWVRFFESSMAYGRFDMKGLKSGISSLKELSGYTVIIE